MSQMLTSFTHE